MSTEPEVSTTGKDNDPSTPSLAHQRQAEAVRIVRDCAEGPLHIRKQGERYLPRFPREEYEDYQERLNTAVFYDWFGRTVRGLTGLVFRQPPLLSEALPPRFRELWENIDLIGTHGDVFAQARHLDGEIDGHFVIFVDMSTRLRRPYWIGLRKQQVLDADVAWQDGEPKLVHFRYRTQVTLRRGRYGQEVVDQIREYNLRNGAVECLVHQRRQGKENEPWEVAEARTMEIDEIPAVAGYHGPVLGPWETQPPHLALALENIKHYQLVSDNDNVLHLCSVPQLAVIGGGRSLADAAIGPHGAWLLPEDGDLKYAEPAGHGLAAAERRIEKSEYRMAIMGLSTLQSERKGPETATSKRINKAESDSQLSLHARGTNDAIEEAIRLTAKWMDIRLPEDDGGRWITLATDFGAVPLDAAMIRAYVEMFKAGFPVRLILEELQQRGGISRTADLDAIEMEMLAEAAARQSTRETEQEPEPEPVA